MSHITLNSDIIYLINNNNESVRQTGAVFNQKNNYIDRISYQDALTKFFEYNYDLEHIYYLRNNVTKLGVTEDTFELDINADLKELPLGTVLYVRNSEKLEDNTTVELIMVPNTSTITINSIDTTYASPYIFVKMLDTLRKRELVTLRFDLIDNLVTNTEVILNTPIFDQKDIVSHTDPFGQYVVNIAGPIKRIDLSDISGTDIDNIRVIDDLLFPMDTVFEIIRKEILTDPITDAEFTDAILSPNFSLCESTVILSGGTNYIVGDTFTINSNISSSDRASHGLIEVAEVDSNGSILQTNIILSGRFDAVPTALDISYNGATGSGYNLETNDLFLISSIDATEPGEHYFSTDSLVVYIDGEATNIFSHYVIEIDNEQISASIADKFGVFGLNVLQPGFNHKHKPSVELININTNSIIPNDIITTNANNFIEILP